jgi:hypothetical protein
MSIKWQDNTWMMNGMDVKGWGHGQIEALSWHLPEKNHDKP